MAKLGTPRKQLLRAAAKLTARAISSGTRNLLSIQWLLRKRGVTMDAGTIGALLVVAYLEEYRARTLSTTTVCEPR